MDMYRWHCPECGNTDLRVVVKVLARLIQEEGNFQTDAVGSHEWDDTAIMVCHKCRHAGQADEFRIHLRPGVILLNNLDPEVLEGLINLPSPWMDQAIEAAVQGMEQEAGRQFQGQELDAAMQEVYEQLEEIDFAKEGVVDGVEVKLFGLGGAWHVMVLDSPNITRASPCTACVPGSANLDSRHEGGILCYDVPEDWRLKDQ